MFWIFVSAVAYPWTNMDNIKCIFTTSMVRYPCGICFICYSNLDLITKVFVCWKDFEHHFFLSLSWAPAQLPLMSVKKIMLFLRQIIYPKLFSELFESSTNILKQNLRTPRNLEIHSLTKLREWFRKPLLKVWKNLDTNSSCPKI